MSCLRYQFILEFSGSWHSSDGSRQQWFPFWSNTYLAYTSRAARGPDEGGSYSVCANSYIHVSRSVGPNERGQPIHLPVGHWVPSTASVMCWTSLTHFEWDFGVNIVLSVYDNKFFHLFELSVPTHPHFKRTKTSCSNWSPVWVLFIVSHFS